MNFRVFSQNLQFAPYLVITSVIPIQHRSIFIMSTGDTRRNQLAIFFDSKSKREENRSHGTSKREREETTPTILVEQTSTFTLVDDNSIASLLSLMKNIVTYCDKTIAQTNDIIKETETDLKKVTGKEELSAIEATIKANESTAKRHLHQGKFKKFNNLKYKPRTTKDETAERTKQLTNIR